MVNALAELIHVSRVEREDGWQPSLKRKTWDDPTKEAIETALEAARPAERPSRRRSFFAFATIDECVYYADSEGFGPDRYFYRVKLNQAIRAPIKLASVPESLLPHRDAIYKHYWNADAGWKVYEYFGEAMVVVSGYDGKMPADAGHVLSKLVDDRNRLVQLAPSWAA